VEKWRYFPPQALQMGFAGKLRFHKLIACKACEVTEKK
jgi:hypothetical protein